MKSKRGGKRIGAGRPRKEETVVIRVPKSLLTAIRKLISDYLANLV